MSSDKYCIYYENYLVGEFDHLDLDKLFKSTYDIKNIETHRMNYKNSQPRPVKIVCKSGNYKFRNGKLELNGVLQEFTSPTYEQWFPKFQKYLKFRELSDIIGRFVLDSDDFNLETKIQEIIAQNLDSSLILDFNNWYSDPDTIQDKMDEIEQMMELVIEN